jgi:hypothetical protein
MSPSGPAPPRVRAESLPPGCADAAEVVVGLGPAAHRESVVLECRDRLGLEARLDVDDPPGGVEARPVDGGLRVEAVLQDPGEDLDERRP